MAGKYRRLLLKLAKDHALDAETAEKLIGAHLQEQDGGPGSGNFGHKGRPGKRGGSSKEGGGSGSGGSESSGKGSSGSSSATSIPKSITNPRSINVNKTGYLKNPASSITDPKELEARNNTAKQLGFRDYQHMYNAAHGMEPAEGKEESKSILNPRPSYEKQPGYVKNPAGGYIDPGELEKRNKTAQELGFRDYAHMYNAAHGMEPAETEKGGPESITNPRPSYVQKPGYVKNPAGGYIDAKELEKRDKTARQLGFADYADMYNAAHGMSSGTMKEPYGTAYNAEHGSKQRDVKASDDLMKRFKKECTRQDSDSNPEATREACRKFVDSLEPGTAFRFDEKSKKGTYDWMIKNKDGTFTYTNKYNGEETTLDASTVADDIANFADPDKALGEFSVPNAGTGSNDAFWTAKREFAGLKPNAGDRYTGTKYTLDEAIQSATDRAEGKKDFPAEKGNASKEYTQVKRDESGKILSAGKPHGVLQNGSGVTGIGADDISKPNPDDMIYNTLGEHCMKDANGNLVMTPEREALHQEIVNDIFKDATKPADGKKVATFLGGGSAAGKGTIQGSGEVGFPSKTESPVIDADVIKESLPEYADTAFSDQHKNAASFAHEESSSLAKRAMQAAYANGYNFTLDGTGDGNVESMKKKIEEAQRNGYSVEGVYVTCPTDLAVERNAARSKTDKYNRLVQEGTVRDIHSKVSHVFPQIASLMDHVVLYDTAQPGGKPVKIAECWKGQAITVHNKKLYQAFLDKDKEPKNNT